MSRTLLALALSVLALGAARAQGVPGDVPEGPGLGAVRDTLALRPGQTLVALPPGLVPRSEALWRVRDSPAGPLVLRLGPEAYRLDPETGRLALSVPAEAGERLAVAYRLLPRLGVAARPPPLFAPDTLTAGAPGVAGVPGGLASPTLAPSRLQTTGSLTRGVVAGSNRDVSVTSGLRMEVAGEVAAGVRVQAVLTDESTPILPEGTTQQLSELDRVFVQLDAGRARARLGDVDLALAPTRFAPLGRKVQGAALETTLAPRGALAGGRALVAGATTRGLFQSQTLVPVEGVQGPYRLRGRQGEQFVLVVPGSERVFLDGVPLVRGEGADYVIDYATGELSFTPARLVTAERRIVVDFEYTTSRFTRTLVVADAEAQLVRPGRPGRATLGVRLLREADGAAFGDELGLSAGDLDAIAAAGRGEALVDGAERVPFNPESAFVLYARRDTLVAGQAFSIFVPARADAPAVFRVRFSRVEDGRGDYRRAGRALNGILYEWVGPGRGDHIPFRVLPRPTRQRVLGLTLRAQPAPGVEAFAEWAQSASSPNTLARGVDEAGGAWEAGARLLPRPLRAGLLGEGTVSAEAARRVRSPRYRPLERIRDVEFARRWNLARAGTPFGLDSLGEATWEGALRWTRAASAGAVPAGGATGLEVGGGLLALADYRAERLALAARWAEPFRALPQAPALGYRLDVARSHGAGPSGSVPRTGGEASPDPSPFGPGLAALLGTGLAVRGEAEALSTWGRFAPSLRLLHERRVQTGGLEESFGGGGLGGGFGGGSFGADTLLAQSYRFVALRPGLGYAAPGFSVEASLDARREAEPLVRPPPGVRPELQDASRALTAEATLALRPRGPYAADARLAYRRRAYAEPFRLAGREDAEAVALRWTARAAPFGRAVEANVLYEALTERAPLLQEAYVLVGPELGTFVWRDGGGEPRAGEPDGIAQVDEFFPETTPLEGVYARTFVPGDALFPTAGVQGQLRLGVRPGRLVDALSPLAPALNVLALRGTLDVRERTTSRDLLRVYFFDPSALQQRTPGPDGPDGAPLGTLAGRFRADVEATLFPDAPRYGGRLGLGHLTTTSRLAAGLEVRLVQALTAEAFGPLGPTLALRAGAGLDRRRAASDGFASRTFDIRALRAEPQLTWTPSPPLALTLTAALASKTDRGDGLGEASGALVVRTPLELRYTRASRLALSARAERADIRLRGVPTAGLALFELTEGRGPGVSYAWGLSAQTALSALLRGSLSYDARAPAGAPLVQTLRVELSAVF